MPSHYSFSEYSAQWPALFEREAERLHGILDAELVAVHHIGSTSVPGLAAKAVIDMLPVVRDIDRIDGRADELIRDGYQSWGENGLVGRRLFTKDDDGRRTHNIHIYAVGHPDIERHLAFCAYLRCHKNVRDEYEALKREVYARHPNDIAAYCDGKDAWIKRMEPVALKWYRTRTNCECGGV